MLIDQAQISYGNHGWLNNIHEPGKLNHQELPVLPGLWLKVHVYHYSNIYIYSFIVFLLHPLVSPGHRLSYSEEINQA